MELLLGAGSARKKWLHRSGGQDWHDLVTCDLNPAHRPDVVCDLDRVPWPFADSSMAEIHAYEVLEHLGAQGDWRAFFAHFGEIWRILQPGGFFAATCPSYRSTWAWGDPSHRRVLTAGSLTFLSQEAYAQVGSTPMSDFRGTWEHDFTVAYVSEDDDKLMFVLRKEDDGEG